MGDMHGKFEMVYMSVLTLLVLVGSSFRMS